MILQMFLVFKFRESLPRRSFLSRDLKCFTEIGMMK